MKNIFIFITYIIIVFNSNLYSAESNKVLKIGLLAPMSGEYKDLGNSLLYSLQLALDEIGDKNVFIIPADSGSNNKEKLKEGIEKIKSQGVKIVFGPIDNEDFDEVKKHNDLIFISPSNIMPEFQNNIISIGISFESQISALINFLKKKRKVKQLYLFQKMDI